jgi:hypothetical protein
LQDNLAAAAYTRTGPVVTPTLKELDGIMQLEFSRDIGEIIVIVLVSNAKRRWL